jgi:hypothetical protein
MARCGVGSFLRYVVPERDGHDVCAIPVSSGKRSTDIIVRYRHESYHYTNRYSHYCLRQKRNHSPPGHFD